MKLKRLITTAWAFAAIAASSSAALAFPTTQVKLVVPLTPGSGADTAARIVAQSLSRTWQQNVIVDNRPGAGGVIGTSAVVNAPADGSTLLFQSAGYASVAAIQKKLPYDPEKQLVEIAMVGAAPYVLVTAVDGPYKSLNDLVSAAKAKPGEINFGSVGVGSSTHFAAEHFAQEAGLQFVHIPYKGGPEVIQDVIAGRAGFAMASLSTALGQIRGGKLRALGLASKTRSATADDIPTIAEQGFPGVDISLWFGVWAPAATPPAVRQQISADLARALQDPEVAAGFSKLGIAPRSMSADQFAVFVREELKKYRQIARDAKIDPQ